MAVAVGKIGHDDRISIVDHLDELRRTHLAAVNRRAPGSAVKS